MRAFSWQRLVPGHVAGPVSRRRGRALASAIHALGLGAFLGGSAGTAAAQCAMCGKNAEYAGGAPGQAYATLATASLILLLPVLSLLAAVGTLLWKYRKEPR